MAAAAAAGGVVVVDVVLLGMLLPFHGMAMADKLVEEEEEKGEETRLVEKVVIVETGRPPHEGKGPCVVMLGGNLVFDRILLGVVDQRKASTVVVTMMELVVQRPTAMSRNIITPIMFAPDLDDVFFLLANRCETTLAFNSFMLMIMTVDSSLILFIRMPQQ